MRGIFVFGLLRNLAQFALIKMLDQPGVGPLVFFFQACQKILLIGFVFPAFGSEDVSKAARNSSSADLLVYNKASYSLQTEVLNDALRSMGPPLSHCTGRALGSTFVCSAVSKASSARTATEYTSTASRKSEVFRIPSSLFMPFGGRQVYPVFS